MSKRISVWLCALLVILGMVITFQLTVIIGNFSYGRVNNQAPSETTGDAAGGSEPDDTQAGSIIQKKLAILQALFESRYIGELDENELADGIAKGYVAYSGDKYAYYFSADEYGERAEDVAGEYPGIGVTVVMNADYGVVEIVSVMPNSPAESAGLLPGDLVFGVDGVDAVAIGYYETIDMIRNGEHGTSVTLSIERETTDGKYEQHDFSITREFVTEQTVIYNMADEKSHTGYIRILQFDKGTYDQFVTAVTELTAKGAEGFILDVRNNGGGLLDSIVNVLDYLLPADETIIRIVYKNGDEEVIKSRTENEFKSAFVVLTNENTASAAELFAAALKDYQKAILVGKTTYGKGTMQTTYPLGDGSALNVSVALYYPPKSDNYEGVGITPHIEVDMAEEFKKVNLFKVSPEDDAQYQAALALFTD